jgi:CheY-like chemotaxis protein
MPDSPLICVVDDEPRIRSLVKEALEMEGHRVEAFEDGESFLTSAREQQPEAVFLDINMPGMSGWEVHQAMRDDPKLEVTRVIALTAQGGPSLEASAEQGLGFDGYIRKPFDLDTLLDAARETPAEA